VGIREGEGGGTARGQVCACARNSGGLGALRQGDEGGGSCAYAEKVASTRGWGGVAGGMAQRTGRKARQNRLVPDAAAGRYTGQVGGSASSNQPGRASAAANLDLVGGGDTDTRTQK
jgi:hypothetical protein